MTLADTSAVWEFSFGVYMVVEGRKPAAPSDEVHAYADSPRLVEATA